MQIIQYYIANFEIWKWSKIRLEVELNQMNQKITFETNIFLRIFMNFEEKTRIPYDSMRMNFLFCEVMVDLHWQTPRVAFWYTIIGGSLESP